MDTENDSNIATNITSQKSKNFIEKIKNNLKNIYLKCTLISDPSSKSGLKFKIECKNLYFNMLHDVAYST